LSKSAKISFEAVNVPRGFIRHQMNRIKISKLSANPSALERRDASWNPIIVKEEPVNPKEPVNPLMNTLENKSDSDPTTTLIDLSDIVDLLLGWIRSKTLHSSSKTALSFWSMVLQEKVSHSDLSTTQTDSSDTEDSTFSWTKKMMLNCSNLIPHSTQELHYHQKQPRSHSKLSMYQEVSSVTR
jgi:hypothetical protein